MPEICYSDHPFCEKEIMPRLNAKELATAQNTEIFKTKARVIKKIWSTFDELRASLQKELAGQPLLAPEGLDTTKGQVAKGDHHHHLPFVFMDMPQYFNRDEICTYRSFFWWGHGLVFALILSGPRLSQYKLRILRDYASYSNKGLHLAVTQTPWEWRQGQGYTIALTDSNRSRIRRALSRLTFVKLERFIPLTHLVFRQNRIISTGIETFHLLRPLLL